MTVLGFKKWYENKLESQNVITRSSNLVEVIGGHIYKFPKRMLQLEMEILGENSTGKKSKNPIFRYLINHSVAEPASIYKDLKKIITEGKKNGSFFYLVGFDFSSNDPKKCYKNSIKIVENFKSSINFLSEIPSRGMGRIESINENYHSSIPSNLLKQRIELIECLFNPEDLPSSIDLPFYFNPNDYTLLEKYEGCLRGILIQSILKKESFEMKIDAMKPWSTSKRISLNENIKIKEDESLIYEMKYKDPRKSSLIHPENKPVITDIKSTVKEITEKRANSVINYLQRLTEGMPIEYIGIGSGYKEGSQTLGISIK